MLYKIGPTIVDHERRPDKVARDPRPPYLLGKRRM